MENWRPVNVSFWQETQQTEGAIILIALIFKPIKLQHPHKTSVVKMGPKKLFLYHHHSPNNLIAQFMIYHYHFNPKFQETTAPDLKGTLQMIL